MGYIGLGEIRRWPVTVGRGLDDVDRTYAKKDNFEKLVARKTLSSEYHPSIYDDERGFHSREETWGPFIRWRMACEKDHAIEYVKAPESIGIMMPAEDILNPFSGKLTKLPHAYAELNMRDTGLYATLEHSFRYKLMDYMRTNVGQNLAAFLNERGYKAEDIDYIGVVSEEGPMIYRVTKLTNGKIAIITNKDAHKKIAVDAEANGTKPAELDEVITGEEMTHIWKDLSRARSISQVISRIFKSNVAVERETKTLLKEFYENLVETTSNPKLKAKYERAVRELEYDISKISRYSKANRNSLQSLAELYCTDMGKLEQILEEEASENGLTGAEDVKAYVAERLDNIAEAVEDYEDVQDGAYAEAELSDGKVVEAEACAEAKDGGETCAETEDGGGAGGDGDAGLADSD